jgi:CheY-like chemotaxis protein
VSKTTRAAAARPLILIVDDIVDNRQMYAEYLEYKGYRVEQARTGTEAVVLAETARRRVPTRRWCSFLRIRIECLVWALSERFEP